MKAIWHDIRYGLRQLRKSPGFTTVAVLSLALGIGANTAIFSLINGILLKSLPVRNPDELRLINWTSYKWPNRKGLEEQYIGRTKDKSQFYCGAFPFFAYREFFEQAEGFSDLFAFASLGSQTINTGDVATSARVQLVSGNFFKSYGARVLIGRPITPEDDRPDAPPVTVLSYHCWQRIFGLDPHVLGQTLAMKNGAFTVIGVLSRNYVGPLVGEGRTDFYVPMMAISRLKGEDWLSSDKIWWVQMMGRLAPGADEARMKSSFELWFSHVVNRSNVKLERYGIWLEEGRRGASGGREETAKPLNSLMGVVGMVLLIACTNLAGLLLARGAARHHEMAVRAAMGAGRWRLIRQSLTESMILSMAGVCLGLGFSSVIKAALTGFIVDPSGNKNFDLQMDTIVVVFVFAVGVLTTLLSGLFPALRAGNTNPSAGLKDSGARGAPRLRLGKILVTTQVGLSVGMVVLGGLFCRSLINLYRVDTGFDTENLLLFPIEPGRSLSRVRVKDREAFLNTICQKIREIPGVQSTALSCRTLLGGGRWSRGISIPGRPDEEKRESEALVVSEGYFETMGIKLLQGREFRSTDNRDSQMVAIVNEEFAREFFPGENPLGQFIKADERRCQIVGLCSNQKYNSLRWDISPILYMPHLQFRFFNLTCAVRSVLPPMSLIPAVRKAVAEVDSKLPLEGITTQKLVLKKSLNTERLYASFCGSLALLALALSCIGLYGLMAYNVTRRTGEMGIRKALGACSWDVAWPILREALILTGIGIAIGLAVGLALVRLIQSFIYGSFFYGVKPYDPLTILSAAVLMVTVAILAAWIPARRAAKIDPMEALRYE